MCKSERWSFLTILTCCSQNWAEIVGYFAPSALIIISQFSIWDACAWVEHLPAHDMTKCCHRCHCHSWWKNSHHDPKIKIKVLLPIIVGLMIEYCCNGGCIWCRNRLKAHKGKIVSAVWIKTSVQLKSHDGIYLPVSGTDANLAWKASMYGAETATCGRAFHR